VYRRQDRIVFDPACQVRRCGDDRTACLDGHAVAYDFYTRCGLFDAPHRRRESQRVAYFGGDSRRKFGNAAVNQMRFGDGVIDIVLELAAAARENARAQERDLAGIDAEERRHRSGDEFARRAGWNIPARCDKRAKRLRIEIARTAHVPWLVERHAFDDSIELPEREA